MQLEKMIIRIYKNLGDAIYNSRKSYTASPKLAPDSVIIFVRRLNEFRRA